MTHSFDFRIATVCGLTESIIYGCFETRTVRYILVGERDRVVRDAQNYWIQSSVAELHREHPYLTKHEIKKALDHLCDEEIGLLRVRKDHGTLWFALGKEKEGE